MVINYSLKQIEPTVNNDEPKKIILCLKLELEKQVFLQGSSCKAEPQALCDNVWKDKNYNAF